MKCIEETIYVWEILRHIVSSAIIEQKKNSVIYNREYENWSISVWKGETS